MPTSGRTPPSPENHHFGPKPPEMTSIEPLEKGAGGDGRPSDTSRSTSGGVGYRLEVLTSKSEVFWHATLFLPILPSFHLSGCYFTVLVVPESAIIDLNVDFTLKWLWNGQISISFKNYCRISRGDLFLNWVSSFEGRVCIRIGLDWPQRGPEMVISDDPRLFLPQFSNFYL